MAVTYFGNSGAHDGSSGLSAGDIGATRFTNGAGTGNVSELGISLHTAYTGNIRLGIYADTGSDSQPGARLLDAGEIVNPGSGWNSLTSLTLSVTNTVIYWLVVVCNANTPANINWDTLTTGGDTYYGTMSGGYGALPTPFPTIGGGEGGGLMMRAGVDSGGATNVVQMII